jgi:sugar lactone lactonase YvrE
VQSARLARLILMAMVFVAALALGRVGTVAAGPKPAATIASDSDSTTAGGSPGPGVIVRPDTARVRLAPAPDSPAVRAAADTLPFALREARRVTGGTTESRGLVEPSGVAVDAFGRLYVADRALHRLVRFDAAGAWLGERGALGSDAGSLRRPSAVALAGTFTVAVLDEDNRRVLGLDLYGERMRVLIGLDDPGVRDVTGPVRPVSLAGDRGGALYVADGDHDRILVFDADGRLQRSIGSYGERPGSFRGLAAVALSRRGELVSAEREGGRIQRLDAGGRAVIAWPAPWTGGRGRLALAVDDSGRVAVADENAGRVWVYAADGLLLARRSDLEGPAGLCFGRPGELWVAEARGGRVRRLDLVAASPRGAEGP